MAGRNTLWALTRSGLARLFNPFAPEPNEVAYDDVLIPAATLGRGVAALTAFQPGGSGGLKEYAWARLDESFATVQLPHRYKENTGVRFHMHVAFQNATTGNVVFEFEYSWMNNNEVAPASKTETVTFAAPGIAWKPFIVPLATIPCPAEGRRISSLVMVRLKRLSTGDTYATDRVFVLSADGHHEVDSLGSRYWVRK